MNKMRVSTKRQKQEKTGQTENLDLKTIITELKNP